ncbi:MAG TPA: glycosyltransferase [Dehalococcoidia bacterium]
MINKRLGIVMYQTSTSKGQELVAQRMVREFNKLGQKAYLITSLFHDGKEVVPAESLQKGPGYLYTGDSVLKIPVIRVDSHIAKWPPRRIIFRDFIHILERIVDKFELNVLITHSTLWNGPEEAAKFATWRRDMRNLGGYQDPIVFCHMSHLQEASPQRYSLPELTFRTAWNKFSLTKIMDAANLILVVTPFEKNSKVKMGGKPEKCFLFPGGVDDKVFLHFAAEDTADFLKRYSINPGTKIVSYLGTIEERKNPMAVLKVAEKLKERQNLHFILAGKGDSTYAEEFVELANSLPNVTYLGEIEEKEKIQLIKASYLNIIMSHLEALGIAQLEFMYCGVPVITSATGGQSWVVQDGVEGFHVKGPDDIDGACNAIVKLLEDDSKYSQMSSNAKAKASKLTISRLVEELNTAIETEMMKESGLDGIPPEVQATLVTPEHALKTWTVGTSGIVATNKRVFIRHGIISRKVTELRYADIKSIEHARRYPWKTLVWGMVISVFLLIAPSLRPIFSSTFVAQIDSWINSIALSTPTWLTSDMITQFLLPLLPLFICIVIFFVGARSGFKLHGIGIKPLYLPRRFREAIGFIREKIDSLVL